MESQNNLSRNPSKESEKSIQERIQTLKISNGKWLKVYDTFTSPIINYMKSFEDMIAIESYILLQITDLVSLYGTKQKPNGRDIERITELIIEKFPYFSVEDFPVFVKNCIGGGMNVAGESFAFGKAYDHLDSQMILEWIGTYCGAKEAAREELHRKNKTEFNNQTREGQAALHEILSKYKEEKKKRPIEWNGENNFGKLEMDQHGQITNTETEINQERK